MPAAKDIEMGIPPEIAGPTEAVGSPGLNSLLGDVETLKGELVDLPEQTPTIGRIVHYTLRDGRNAGQERPAIITRVWNPECVQLTVFTDAPNDELDLCYWASSVHKGTDAGQWHWPSHGVAIPMESSS